MQLMLRGVGVSIGSRDLFDSVTLTLNDGDSLALMGPSGVGKSTLLSVIAGFSEPSRGTAVIEGAQPNFTSEYLLQSAPLLVRRSVIDNVRLGRQIQDSQLDLLDEEAASILMRLGLENQALVPVYKLSGGERQRVAVARAALNHSNLLLADEPTASLDAWSRDVVMNVLLERVNNDGIVVVATHDPAVAERCTTVLKFSTSTVKSA